ncbi:MAG: SDR family NAD(P)-dependent oxidoreductase [Pseudomonadales bacterium]
MAKLSGQHAFITGGGSGIGLACAKVFIEDGAQVTLMGRRQAQLEAALTELKAGNRAHYLVGDIAIESSVAEAIAQAHRRAPLSIVIANAGTGAAAPLLDTSSADWEAVIQTNLNGTFYTIKHGAVALRSGGTGTMCAVSSIAGLRTHRYMSAYCASKAGIDMLVRNAADELGDLGIRVNSVCPGLVETQLSTGLHEHDAMRNDYLDCMPVRRTGQPEDIARAVRFLSGPESSWITGVSLPVDGGHHLRRGPNLDHLLNPAAV